MGQGFDSALLNREKARRELAAVLEEKYESEAASARRKRFLGIGIFLACAYFGARNMGELHATTSPELMMGQMKKQIAAGDSLMIGAAPKRPPAFSKDNVPFGLLGDLNRPKQRRRPAPQDYTPLSGKLALEIKELAKRREAKAAKIDCGRYRPSQPLDAPPRALTSFSALRYTRLETPPTWLAPLKNP